MHFWRMITFTNHVDVRAQSMIDIALAAGASDDDNALQWQPTTGYPLIGTVPKSCYLW